MKPFFSIIIPIYNSEKTIVKAIKSVVEQSYSDWELLLVDDGSVDGSAYICKCFLSDKIKYIHQNNKGPQAARNNGVMHSVGEYIIFLDSDDYLSLHALNCLYKYIKTREPEIVYFQEEYIENSCVASNKLTQINEIEYLNSNDAILKRCFLDVNFGFGQCGGCFSRKLFLSNLSKLETSYRYCEDILIGYLLLKNSNSVLLVPDKLYFYIRRNDSTTHSLTGKDIFGQFEIFNYIFEDLYKANKFSDCDFYPALDGGLAYVLFRYVEKGPRHDPFNVYKKNISTIRNSTIVKHFLLNYKFDSKRIKIGLRLFKFKLYFLCYLFYLLR